MENALVLCGGSGAHSGVAFTRFHILGYPLGFFREKSGPIDFPTIFLIDQDAGDSPGQEPTAWQLNRRLVEDHPGRHDWRAAIGRREAPQLIQATPLPVGANQAWSRKPCHQPRGRFERSQLLEIIASEEQMDIDFSKGMMGSPAIGSLLFRLKDFDERGKGLNHDKTFAELLQTRGRVVVVGSGIGGTGASVAPTVARRLAEESGNHVMAVMLLRWFEFELGADVVMREKAQARNRVMHENANSAFEFYGQTLARSVATVPVGMPEQSISKRRYTGDVGQPIHESYIHAVTALCAYRQFLGEQAFGPGLYLMGAVEKGRLAGSTAIPGGTLQGLASQGETLARVLDAWCKVLRHPYHGRIRPAIHTAVGRRSSDPLQVADRLERELEVYREQLDWLKDVVGIEGKAQSDFGLESESRERLRNVPFEAGESPEDVASALFYWTATWIRSRATAETGLEIQAGGVGGAHWPDLRNTGGLGIAPRSNGNLDRVEDADGGAVLEAFIDPEYLSCNGWPHPLAPVEFFRHSVDTREAKSLRQLEMLLVGLVTRRVDLRSIDQGADPTGLSLERLFAEYRRDGYEALATWAVVLPEDDGLVVAFTSPFTLLCPTSSMLSEEGTPFWNQLWRELSESVEGADWSECEEPTTWGDQDLAVRQVRSWIDHQKRMFPGASPPWTAVFERYQGKTSSVPFGTGESVRVLWGSPSDPERSPVDLNLPIEAGRYIPAPGTPLMDEEDLVNKVPELLRLLDDDGQMLFEMVELELPGRPSTVRGFWDEHLDLLRQRGKIYIWSWDDQCNVVIVSMTPSGLQATILDNSRVLSRSDLVVRRCAPLIQDPVVSRQSRKGEILYPDLPIRSELFDLVQTEDGEHLLANLKKGVYPRQRWQPREMPDLSGRKRLRWDLRLRGRRRPLPVEIALEAHDADPQRAHWMVWPRFRSKDPAAWKAYYVYEKFPQNNKLSLETLWLQGGEECRLQKLVRDRNDPKNRDMPAYPIAYRTGSNAGFHAGGPPLAFSIRHSGRDEELGLYLIDLELLGTSPAQVQLAIDFGTSHSVAAVKVGLEETRHVNLRCELEEGGASGLTFHLSEDQRHVMEPEASGGLLATSGWLPTYSNRANKGFLPSELLLYSRLSDIQGEEIEDWIPGSTYRIPPMDIGRQDLSEYLLADFKWDAGSKFFRGKEALLRENYLAYFLELVLAEVVYRHLKALPEQLVSCTFTYPLRSTEGQVQVLQQVLRRVLGRSQESLGIPLGLHENVGIYDESRAAQEPTNKFGEVCAVADLGGGTLDLYVAADSTGINGKFPEIADSTRIGGNRLLQQIARAPQGILPAGWWDENNGDSESRERDIETKLRAWMRSQGSANLFGRDAEGQTLDGHGVRGIANPAQGNHPRALLDRYFYLIIEYLARSLTAYLYTYWYPAVSESDRERLKISVQLRGNGWLLRYEKQSHTQATQAIQDAVRSKVTWLWKQIPDNPFPAPGEGNWLPAARYEMRDPRQGVDPKVLPVMNAVGQAMPFEEVKASWRAYTLARLEVLRASGREQIEWFAPVPFETGGSQDVELDGISPPLVLTKESVDRQHVVHRLPGSFEGSLNENLKSKEAVIENGSSYRAPVAPLIWEAVFDSKAYWPGES